MASKKCQVCNVDPPKLKRPKSGQLICQSCFFAQFEAEVHETIVQNNMFEPGDVVACGASGGKDSTVLMHLMKTLNERHGYGIKLVLVSVDEGIHGYRDDSLKTVHRNAEFYQLPLHIVSFKKLYGWSMDEIVTEVGAKSNCTFCGVFRRQALDKGATEVRATKVVTGHNADDTAETILMNMLRGDVPRLARCATAVTNDQQGETIPRLKPMKYAYEKEIVLYAHYKKLDYFTTECTYSTEAFRGNARTLVKDLEAIQPSCIANVIHSGETMKFKPGAIVPSNPLRKCSRCGYPASQEVCRACVLLDSLNKGQAKLALKASVPPSTTNTNTGNTVNTGNSSSAAAAAAGPTS